MIRLRGCDTNLHPFRSPIIVQVHDTPICILREVPLINEAICSVINFDIEKKFSVHIRCFVGLLVLQYIYIYIYVVKSVDLHRNNLSISNFTMRNCSAKV